MCNNKFLNFIDDFYEAEKHRLPNFIPVGIGLGISLYFSLDNEPNFLLNISILIFILGLLITAKSNRWIWCIFVTIGMGFFVAQLRTKTTGTFMLAENNKKPVSLVARVESCEKTEKGLIFIVNSVKSKKYPQLTKLSLTWRGKNAIASGQDYIPGSKVLFCAILSPIHPRAFPNSYDFKKRQYFNGIGARGFIIKQPKILKKAALNSVSIFFEQIRHTIDKKIEKCLPTDIASVSKALITGNKSGISQETRKYFANSGTAHLLAISGLHLGIIGFFIFWFFRIFLCYFPGICMFYDTKKIAALISWAVVLFYLFISGKSVPSVRAFIMHTIIILAVLMERRAITMRSTAIAATIIMLFSPEVILFPSFQMSFGAVIAIVALYEQTWNFSKYPRILFNIMATTLVASIPTAIFSMYTFNQLTLNSILANVVSIPLMTFFIMPLAVIALFCMTFNLSQPFILMMGYGVKLLIKISELSSQLPGSYFIMPTPTAFNMAIFIFSGLILTMVHHRIRFYGIAGIIIAVIYYYYTPTADIFISPQSKAWGIKTKDAVCFNHLGYFRSITSAWAKSVGFEKREKFHSKNCKKCIRKISDNTYSINTKNQSIIITDDANYSSKSGKIILLNKNNNFAEIIYLPSFKSKSNKYKARPWS
ncbi:MAG: ComEC family competence protein [Holosporaceae bacterium]|jgi:competence protein ComEC|nr:ComEC family competence protein [Holosporaceae bacterium]